MEQVNYDKVIADLQQTIRMKDAVIASLKAGMCTFSSDVALRRELELKNRIISGECIDWAEACGLLEKLGIIMNDGYSHKTVPQAIQELYDKLAAQLRTMSTTIIRCKSNIPKFTSPEEFPGPFKLVESNGYFEITDKNGDALFRGQNKTMASLAVDCMNLVFDSV